MGWNSRACVMQPATDKSCNVPRLCRGPKHASGPRYNDARLYNYMFWWICKFKLKFPTSRSDNGNSMRDPNVYRHEPIMNDVGPSYDEYRDRTRNQDCPSPDSSNGDADSNVAGEWVCSIGQGKVEERNLKSFPATPDDRKSLRRRTCTVFINTVWCFGLSIMWHAAAPRIRGGGGRFILIAHICSWMFLYSFWSSRLSCPFWQCPSIATSVFL